MERFIQVTLLRLARTIIGKYHPRVIGITGSIGKTTSREAVFAVLEGGGRVRRSAKNYNNEIGVPLTIIGADSPGRSFPKWLGVYLRGLRLILFPDASYPKILILELGVDKPGDMDHLLRIVTPEIAVLTFLGLVHVANFPDREALINEKTKLIKAVPVGGCVIVNFDNEEARDAARDVKVRTLTYGLEDGADIRGMEVKFGLPSAGVPFMGVSLKIAYRGSCVPVFLPNVLGYHAVYAALAAAAVGLAIDLNLVAIAESLKTMQSPRGRLTLIPGIKNTTLIDDTYNAEPESMIAALGALKRFTADSGARKFAVLGDMLELGALSEAAHARVGTVAAECGIDELILAGELAVDLGEGAIAAGFDRDRIFHFPTSFEAGKFLQDRLRPGDIALIKGSQGVRMEKAVLEVMAEPLRASELLVRMDGQWKNR